MAESMVHVDDQNFETITSEGVVLVDFYADWCGPCRIIAPIIAELATEFKGQAVIAKVDVDKAQETAAKFQITSIPTLILFKDGVEAKRIVGIRDKATLKSLITAAL